jgi:hypothetical protein
MNIYRKNEVETDSDISSEYPKRRRSVVGGCSCDLDLLPERFILFSIEKQLEFILNELMNKKFCDIEKEDWLYIKRNLRELNKQIQELKDDCT